MSELAEFTQEEDRSWARKLLPQATHSRAALFEGKVDDVELDRQGGSNEKFEEEHVLKGVRYAALTAPVPSGLV